MILLLIMVNILVCFSSLFSMCRFIFLTMGITVLCTESLLVNMLEPFSVVINLLQELNFFRNIIFCLYACTIIHSTTLFFSDLDNLQVLAIINAVMMNSFIHKFLCMARVLGGVFPSYMALW